MKFQIARDARPQARTLIIAAAITLALWFIPYASVLAYSFRLFVTFIHEGGHALAAVLTGNSVQSLSVSFDTSGLTVVFGFVAPLTNFSVQPFTVLAGATITAGLLAAAKYLPLRAANFLVGFLAVQCVLNAVFDLKSLAFMSVASSETTDAVNMAAATGVPAIIWALLWAAVGFIIVSLALRAYSVSRSRPSQPDLPFEDPLEV